MENSPPLLDPHRLPPTPPTIWECLLALAAAGIALLALGLLLSITPRPDDGPAAPGPKPSPTAGSAIVPIKTTTMQTLEEAVAALGQRLATQARAGETTLNPLEKVDASRGCPMGRTAIGNPPAGQVRLFKMRINKDGADQGGAYWGINLGAGDMYCATDYTTYQAYTRAHSRVEAAANLGLGLTHLSRRR